MRTMTGRTASAVDSESLTLEKLARLYREINALAVPKIVESYLVPPGSVMRGVDFDGRETYMVPIGTLAALSST